MAISLLKLGLLMLSNFGYWEFFRKKCNIGLYFLPVFTIATQFLILFFAGLPNLISEAAWGIYFGGLLFAFDGMRKNREYVFLPYLNCGYAIFVGALLLTAFAVRGKLFGHYDNFSHWAVVVKVLLNTGRFPNFLDSLISFQSYPLGSSAYIFYFCKMTRQSESFQMLAQAFMMLTCMLPWFNFVKQNKVACSGMILVMGNFLLCYNTSIYNLLVDTLLPLSGMATILFIYQEYISAVENCDENKCLYAIPLLCWCAQIKNSGLFFSLVAVALLLATPHYGKKGLWRKIEVALSPAIIYLLWNRHCDYVFKAADKTKHAMRLENFSSVLSGKELSSLGDIFQSVAKFAFSRQGFFFLLIWLVVLGVLTLLFATSRKKLYLKLLSFSVILYLLYMICVGCMYIFSMPLAEAKTLSGIERYMKTVDILIYGLSLCYALTMISSIKKKQMWALLGAGLIAFHIGIGIAGKGKFVTIFQQYDVSLRTSFQGLINDYEIPEGQSYLICVPGKDTGYYSFLCKYLLNSTECRTMSVQDKDQLEQYRDKYKYLLIMDKDNTEITEWIQENYSEQSDQNVVRINK